MPYEYDVFLSYRRVNAWPMFVDKLFLPMLRHWLTTEMGQNPRIFFDSDLIETGQAWPQQLAAGVASSKLMVCLWSKEYFASPWCQAELGIMMARRDAAAQAARPLPLILAAVIHDGEDISPRLDDIQRISIQKYANPWLVRGSPNMEKLSEHIRKFAVHINHALQQVPECDPSWLNLAIDRFVQLFKEQVTQREVPSLGRAAS